MIRTRFQQLCVLLFFFIVTSSGQADQLDDQAVTYANFDFIYAVTASNSHAYFATVNGVIRYNKTYQFWERPLTGTDDLNFGVIDKLWIDRFDQTLYAASGVSLFEYETFFRRWFPLGELPGIDSDNRHVAPPEFLVPGFDANYMGNGRFADLHGGTAHTTDIVDDGSGNLWIGTWGLGPAVADRASGTMELLPYGLLQDRVDLIVPDDSVLWLAGALTAGHRSGLTAFFPEQNAFSYIESGVGNNFPAVDITCLVVGPEKLFVGTPRGLFLVERSSQHFEGPLGRRHGLADNHILSLATGNNQLFVGTANGLSQMTLAFDSVSSVRPELFANQRIFDLEMVDQTLWIASSAGAFRYTPDSERLQQFQDPQLVLFGEVYALDRFDDDLWLAADAGAVRLGLKTGRIKSIRSHFDRFGTRPMVANERLVALAAPNGLELIFLDAEGNQLSRSVTTTDGLPSNLVLSLLLDGDYIWVGTDAGLTRLLWNHPMWTD